MMEIATFIHGNLDGTTVHTTRDNNENLKKISREEDQPLLS
jgi:hypothetical protein